LTQTILAFAACPIVKDDEVIGMLTERDPGIRLPGCSPGIRAAIVN